MNRTDRMLAIVLELQGRGRARAEDLAQTFETSKRTIYRDMLALGQAGVPIVSIPGRGFSLVEGYFLPPLSFTADEATLLLLGADVMAQSFDTRYRAAAQSASRKIAGALPERQRAAVQALRESIHFVASEHRFSPIPEALQQLRSAILSRRTVRFAYYARRSQSAHDDARLAATGALPTPGLREADPYALAHVSGAWYLLAWDHQRRAMRNFRLDRMDDLTTLDTTFTRQPDRQRLQRDIEETATLTARVLFAPEVARWVREAPSFFAVALEDTPEGLMVTLRLRAEEEALSWLLSWGRHARVIEPASLQHLVAAEAKALLQRYQD